MKTLVALASLSFVAALSLFTVACSGAGGGSTGSSSSAASTEDFCVSFCQRQADCDKSVDMDTCKSKCSDTTATTISRIRGDVVGSIESCFQSSDCKTALSDGGLDTCVRQAAASTAPDDATKDACLALSDVADHCGADPLDMAGCFDHLKVYDDAVLAQVKKCTTKDCGAVADCVNAALGQE